MTLSTPDCTSARVRWPAAGIALLLISILLCSCEGERKETRRLYAFGTVVTLTAWNVSASDMDAATDRLEQRYRVLDRDWYPWPKADAGTSAATGQLVALNAAIAAGRPYRADPELQALIQRGMQLEPLSGGRFSIATGRLSEIWGLVDPLQPPATRPRPADIQSLLSEGISARHLYWAGDELASHSRAIVVDLGAIAKGTLLRISVEMLKKIGIDDAIVDIGGDLVVIGARHGAPVRIGIRAPDGHATIAWVELGDGEAALTSGSYERYVELDGVRYPHILDPRDGQPVRHTVSVTVIDRDPELADAAATALMVAGPTEFDETCDGMGIRQAMLVDAAGELRLTSEMRMRVNWTQ